jgi:hypothetical protein
VVAVVVAEVTTTDAREAAALAMVDVTAMENGTNNVGHIREMIVVTAVARTAADRAAIAGAVATTATSRSRQTTAGRSLPGTLMGTTVEVVEEAMETTAAGEEVAVVMTGMEAAMVVEEARAAVRRTGRNRLRGTRESKLSSLGRARLAGAESTLTGTRISRLKRLETTSRPVSSPLPRWSSRL